MTKLKDAPFKVLKKFVVDIEWQYRIDVEEAQLF